jgi:signal transduction histidine kinase
MTGDGNRDILPVDVAARRVSLGSLLGAVTLLAAVVVAVSLASLGRLVKLSTEQRLERGRDVVQRELDHFASRAALDDGPLRPSVLGLRGAVVEAPPGALAAASIRSGLDPEVDRALGTLVTVAPRDRAETGSLDVEGGTVFIGARRHPDGRVLWAAYSVASPRHLAVWRTTVAVLAAATILLAACALAAVVGARRGARSLERSLRDLEGDLHAEVPRPAVAEMARVADGVATLARRVAEAQDERENLARELGHKERLAALGRVVAGVAHEVRNPLASMKLRVDLARTDAGVPDATRRDLDGVADEIVRLDRLVTDFLVVTGKRSDRAALCDLGALARTRAAQLAPWADERGVTIEVRGDAATTIDPEACARALDNLVRNAVEASPRAGRVCVSIEPKGAEVTVAVEDDGPGVPDADVARLFEPFFTTKPDGTGLGLAVSRAIAQAAGGQLVYAREGDKTRFAMHLMEAS